MENGCATCNEFALKFLVLIAFAMEVVISTWHPIVDKRTLIIMAAPRDLFCFRICKYVSHGPGAKTESLTAESFSIIC
jgi:hypothetical protein